MMLTVRFVIDRSSIIPRKYSFIQNKWELRSGLGVNLREYEYKQHYYDSEIYGGTHIRYTFKCCYRSRCNLLSALREYSKIRIGNKIRIS
jgi:hypothetical protein